MSYQNFVPEFWSTNILWHLRKQLIFTGLTNRDYEGEVRQAGDTVKIQTPEAITVKTYSSADVVYEETQSSQQALVIDQQKYWAFEVPDIDELQSNISLMRTYLQEGSYAMADTIDQDVASLYTAAGHSVSLDVSSDSTGVRTALVEANRKLTEANVPRAGRWMVLSPLVFSKVKLATDFTPATGLGDGILVNGYVGRLEGFALYESNNVPVATQHKCIFGTNAAMTLAIQKEPSVEALRLEKRFSDAVRSLMVWGRRVVRPAALGLLDVTVA